MGRRATLSALALFICVALVPGAAFGGAKKKVHFVVGPDNLVAPLSIPLDPHAGPVPNCHKPAIKCVKTVIRRLHQREVDFGCNHRAIFATTYRVLTQQALKALEENPNLFQWPRFFYFEDALFANVYIGNGKAFDHGKRIPPAWKIAFDTAARDDTFASQDLLLGINAHVQNDMPFVIAALGTKTKNGTLRKSDHDIFNHVLTGAYQAVIDELRARYDPSLDLTNSSLTPADDEAGLILVSEWREDVWTNANKLIAAAGDPAKTAEVTRAIEQNAADYANAISAQSVPGYGASRDAYCASHNPDA